MSIIDINPDRAKAIAAEITRKLDAGAHQVYHDRDSNDVASNIKSTVSSISQHLDDVDPELRQRVLKELRVTHESNILSNQAKLHKTHQAQQALSDAMTWYTKIIPIFEALPLGGILPIEKNDCSRLHTFKEAVRDGMLINTEGGIDCPEEFTDSLVHTFVVKHDWARAFEGAQGLPDVVHLPYDMTIFEFRLFGKTVLSLFTQVKTGTDDDEDNVEFMAFVQCGPYWISLSHSAKTNPVLRTVFNQVRAICLALEAGVAVSNTAPAPAKLNAKRARDGKIPLSDFHIVDIAKRHKSSRSATSTGAHTGIRQRLHFRSGYTRLVPRYKRVKWYLAGDPDLGFIHKQYSL
jgi:hypothetical protein